ncbi:D-glucuronyl C5-epimerase family protein [Streptomyces sp. NPDC051219]|uniref:D-glucuronyl C5-epimerase family protein n=1 Tax=Streptomyces sp. NPDC051219 TaxID=3155283 RepID=UPI0034126456
MAGKRRADVSRRRLIRAAGGTVAGVAVVGGGTVTAMATGVLDDPTPVDPFAGMPKSLALDLPGQPHYAGLTELPDPLAEGTVTAPSRRIPYETAMPNPSAVAAAVPTTLPFTFKMSGYRIVEDVPDEMQPWRDLIVPRVDTGLHDAAGVRMFKAANGRVYNHPVAQLQYGLSNLNTWRRTRDSFYLDRARAQAERLIDTRVEARGAWYFPYPFDYSGGAHTSVRYTGPWYSGMAQGEALSFFAQLAQIDIIPEDARTLYKAAADGAFGSMLRGTDGKPWVVAKDSKGYLWIQEYPGATPETSDFTYNGFLFALLGLWDYFKLTGNPLAQQLFDGSLTTIYAHFTPIRNKGWISYYCVPHRLPNDKYHNIHIELLRQMQWLSGSTRSAYLSDVLMDDYPTPKMPVSGNVAMAAGTHTLYRFDGNGAVTATKKLTVNSATQAPTKTRVRIKGRGVHYLITAGTAKDWYIAESFPRVFLRGQWFTSTYMPRRVATFPKGISITCYKFATNGATGATKTVKFAGDSNAPFDVRAIVNGRPMVRITAGALKDYWAPCSQVLTDGR